MTRALCSTKSLAVEGRGRGEGHSGEGRAGRSEKRAGPRAVGSRVRRWTVFHACGAGAAPRCPERASPDANSASMAHGWGGEVAEQFPSLGNIRGTEGSRKLAFHSPTPRLAVEPARRTVRARERGSWKEPAVADILEQAPRMIHRGRQTSWPPAAGKQGLCGRGAGPGPTGLGAARQPPPPRGPDESGAPQQVEASARRAATQGVGSRTHDTPRFLPRGPLAVPCFPESHPKHVSQKGLFKNPGNGGPAPGK